MISTVDELTALVERVSAYSARHPHASIVEISVAADPYSFPTLYAGIGAENGFVQEYWNPSRSTIGDQGATGTVIYDLQGNGTEVPAVQQVPMEIVREVLEAYLGHDGVLPANFPALHPIPLD
ncbi:hypothetical protein ADL03_28670 [Nocardia sp. NRRL S-836]|nr:hypothetical protein ADL03_28670 [Nocardia sp. NRRL S-836]